MLQIKIHLEVEKQTGHLPPQVIYFSQAQLQFFTPCILATSGTAKVGNRWLQSAPKCSSLQLLPLPHVFFFFYSIVGHLHVLHSVRINFLQHASSMGHSLDIYSNGVVSTGCSEIFSHLHRLLSMSGQSALSWGLKRWQLLQKMSTCSSTSCSLDICSGVGISMI